jgi:hypothetical protein
MRSVYSLQLEINPSAGESPSQCVARLRETVTAWVIDRLHHKWRAASPSVSFDGTAREPLPHHSVKATLESEGETEIADLVWSHPHDGGSKWITHCTMASCASGVAFAMHLRLQSNEFDLRPLTFQLGRPSVIDTIIRTFRCSVTGVPVSLTAKLIDDDDVDELVSDVLLSPARHLPVIAVSVDAYTDQPLVSADEIQKAVLGFASVVMLKDKWAAFRLTDAIGKPLSCYNGAVRLYWPGLTIDADPFDHPLFLAPRLTGPGRPAQQDLFRLLNSIASFRFRESAIISQARTAVEGRRAKELDAARQLLSSGSMKTEELEKALEKSWDEEKRLRELLAEREEKIAELTNQLDAQRQSWTAMRRDSGAALPNSEIESKATSGFSTVADAIAAAKRDFAGPGKPLVFLERAEEVAAESPYKQPDKVYEFLKSLHDVAQSWKKNKGALGKDGWRGALEKEGFVYKPGISQTTRTKWGDEYTFKYNGEKFLFEEHVTLGAGDPNTCASVHWILDKKNMVVVVGHCGRHLPNTRT